MSSFVFKTSALSSFDLSIKAAILFGSNKSFFSNSDTCLTSSSTFSGFCFFSSFVSTFFKVLSGSGNSKNIINVLKEAKKQNCNYILNKNGKLKKVN